MKKKHIYDLLDLCFGLLVLIDIILFALVIGGM